MTRIDIGGGTFSPEGWINLDPAHGEGEWKRRIQDGIPMPDDSVEAVRCSHLMEHIPAGAERIFVMNEVHRVLVPGGTFEIIVPLLTGSWHAIADPTHVSFWVYESFLYFTGEFQPHATYGIKFWKMINWFVHEGFEGNALLQKS